MAGEIKTFNGCPDWTNENGEWQKYRSEMTPDGRIGYGARGAQIWRAINARTLKGGVFQKVHPQYVGTSNDFTSFQAFMNWAINQPGYDCRDLKGEVFHIDKDILTKGNKSYSDVTCCFVPCEINILLTDCAKARGDNPLGVSFHRKSGLFRATCSTGGKQMTVGSFGDMYDAHRAWQNAKILAIQSAIGRYRDGPGFQQRVVDALMRRVVAIELDMQIGLPTVSL